MGFVTVLALIGPPQDAVAPATTAEGLRALIYAGDRAAVDSALAALPVDSREAQNRQRGMFGVFTEVHPKVMEFAQAWALDEPTNPLALAARGWSLHSLAWAYRGEALARDVYPPAMAAFVTAQIESLALMQEAVRLQPDLLAASDGVLKIAYTIGRHDLIAPELARIMDLVPNRYSLTLAGQGNDPKWGGDPTAAELLCKTHAAKVTAPPGYDAQVCLADGIMAAQRMTFPEMIQALGPTDNPLILEWQDVGADIRGATAAEKLAHLDRLMSARPLTYLEANVYDQMAAQVASITGEERPPELPAAIAREAEDARHYADRNPGDWQGAYHLLNARIEDRDVNGTEFDYDDFRRRAVESLQINPYSAAAWSHLGMDRMQQGGDEMANILAAEPFLINASVYSNHASDHLKMLGTPKLALLFRNLSNGVKPAYPALWQEGVLCPMVRQLRLLESACAREETPFQECTGLPWDAEAIHRQIAELTSAGICQTESGASLDELAISPVPVDLTMN